MTGAWVGVSLTPQGEQPVYVQLYEQLRDLILRRALRPQERLPSSRLMAAELGVSRATVVAAYDQLVGEGYIAGRPGSGMYVCPLPDDTLAVAVLPSGRGPRPLPRQTPPPGPKAAGDWTETPGWAPPLQPGEPDGRLFPSGEWARALSNSWRRPSPRVLGHGETVFGDPALRQALARHLQVWRGIDVAPEQVIITAGAGEGIDLTLRAFVAAGEGVVLENPGYAPARNMVTDRGGQVIHCPVDSGGLLVEALPSGPEAGPPARLILTTPSRHFPLGYTMPLPRRLSLIDWARQHGSMILEDDYDSEFRYAGRPLAALASLDHDGRVIYLGSFSKVFASGVRLGYLAVPVAEQDRYRACLEATGPRASLALQPALAEFMDSGAYARHLRRMRRVYAERQDCLLKALAADCGGWLTVPEIQPSGMHVVARLTEQGLAVAGSDQALAGHCRTGGLVVRPLSSYCQPPVREQGLLIGFAAYTPQEIKDAVVNLRMILTRLS